MERALEAIREYCVEEFNSEADISDITKIGIGYTTSEDGEHEIQWYADLARPRLYAEIDGEFAFEDTYKSCDAIADDLDRYGEFMFEFLYSEAVEWLEEEEEK